MADPNQLPFLSPFPVPIVILVANTPWNHLASWSAVTCTIP